MHRVVLRISHAPSGWWRRAQTIGMRIIHKDLERAVTWRDIDITATPGEELRLFQYPYSQISAAQ